MRYQIYEAKSVKHDAQQRVGIISETRNPTEIQAYQDIAVNHLIGFGKGRRFMRVNALRFEDRKEIFRHGIVIRISSP